MEVEITWRRTIRIWWSYLWRHVIAIVAAMFAGGIVGGIIGFVMGALGADVRLIQIIALPVGLVIGLGFSIVPLKMILGKNFGEFRLVLIKNE